MPTAETKWRGSSATLPNREYFVESREDSWMANPKNAPNIPNQPPDDAAQLNALLGELEKARGRPALVYWTTPLARISMAAEIPLFDQLRATSYPEGLDFILNTTGGDTEAPWRFVSLIREYTDRLSVLIPHYALSAGTVIALGADEIVMTPLSTLGPIDPSRRHPLLPKREGAEEPEPISVQDMRHAMQFIQEAASSNPGFEYTPEAMAQIFDSLFDKIHPLAIGAIEQSYALAKLIGARCLATHMKDEGQAETITKIVSKLCDDYKSHLYRIGRKEAKALELNVVNASAPVDTILTEILKFYNARPVGPFGSGGRPEKTQIAWIDSIRIKFRCEQKIAQVKNNQIEVQGDAWVPY